jgi:hypothetical protein
MKHWTTVSGYRLMDELGSPFASWHAPYPVQARLDQEDNIKAVKSVIVHGGTEKAREIEIRFNKRETKILLGPYLTPAGLSALQENTNGQ